MSGYVETFEGISFQVNVAVTYPALPEYIVRKKYAVESGNEHSEGI